MPFSHLSAQLSSLPLAVYSDFDGTVTHPDTMNFLAETYGGQEFRRKIGMQIASGEVTLRDGILQELAVIRGTFDANIDFLRKHVVVDPEFAPFARWCDAWGIPLTLLSGGMDKVIETLLEPFHLPNVRLLSNKLIIENGFWSMQFLDETPWGHDKSKAILEAKAQGFCTVFLGDGLSDRRAAEHADVIFTKGSLARFCDDKQIPHLEFVSFSEVRSEMERFLALKGD